MGSLEHNLVCLDQLALAREQLQVREPVHGRFAHILTDNAVELMLHYQAESALANSWLHAAAKQKSDKAKAEILGRKFAPKIRFARELGIVNQLQAEYILTNHEYRNELYHVGLAHERVIYDIAVHYHAFACALVQKLKYGPTSFSFPLKVPPRIKSAWENSAQVHKGSYENMLCATANAICVTNQLTLEPLGRVLADALIKRVAQLDDAINWIVKYDPNAESRVQVIVDVQLWSAMFDEERRLKCRPIATPEQVQKILAPGSGDPLKLIKKILAPPITTDVVARWKSRAPSLKSESDPIKSLKKYHSLMREMEDLYEDIMRHGGALESYLEQLRGK